MQFRNNKKSINKTNHQSNVATKPPQRGQKKKLEKSYDIGAFLRLLHPDTAFEIRVPNTCDNAGRYRGTSSGYYDCIPNAVDNVKMESKYDPPGIYVTLNPVNKDLLARSENCNLTFAKQTTKDEDVTKRRWVLIDIDPVRASGICSTDAELACAKLKAKQIRPYLRSLGWPEPVPMISGNGAYLLYRVDLAADDASSLLIQQFLQLLKKKFDDDQVEIDGNVFNASRVIRVAGTWNRKGDDFKGREGVAARPHRRAYFYPPSSPPKVVTRKQISDLVSSSASIKSEGSQPTTASAPSPRKRPKDSASYRQSVTPAAPAAVAECRRKIAGMPAAVSGQNGSKQTFTVACRIAESGLNESQGMELLKEYNERCEPPWTEKELRHKLTSAYKRVLKDKTGSPRPSQQTAARPTIEVRPGRDHETVDAICTELGRTRGVFVGPSHQLVEVGDSNDLTPINQDAVRTRIARVIQLQKTDAKGKRIDIKCDVALGRQVHSDGRWPGIPVINAITKGPTILADGRVLQEKGLDPESGIYVMSIPEGWEPVPDIVTKEMAIESINALADVVSECRFVEGDTGQAGWLALVLTGVSRAAIDGPVPMFITEAKSPGSGKTMLIDLASIIATGSAASFRTRQNSEETHKEIVAGLISGRTWIAFDNERQGGVIHCPVLASLLTSHRAEGRILKSSSMVSGPNRFLLTTTGNHLSFSTEIARRSLLIEVEKQADRKWKIDDLRSHVTAKRAELLRHAIVVLRYGLSQPTLGMKPLESFEVWSRTIRETLVKLDLPDPVKLVDAAKRKDSERDQDHEFARAVMTLIQEVKRKRYDKNPYVSATEIAEHAAEIYRRSRRTYELSEPSLVMAVDRLRERCISSHSKVETLSAGTLGRRLASVVDVPVDGKKIVRGGKNNYYKVTTAKSADD